MSESAFLFNGVFKILIPYFSVLRYCVRDNINRVINALVHTFNPVADEYLPLKKLTVINARKVFDFFNQLKGFFLRDEF